jgi:hypothetical protein
MCSQGPYICFKMRDSQHEMVLYLVLPVKDFKLISFHLYYWRCAILFPMCSHKLHMASGTGKSIIISKEYDHELGGLLL